MIPGVREILAMLLAGECDAARAEAWIEEHIRLAELRAIRDERDDLARDAMVAMLRFGDTQARDPKYIGTTAYAIADGMLEASYAREAV